jgi:hypothetical protein
VERERRVTAAAPLLFFPLFTLFLGPAQGNTMINGQCHEIIVA